MGIRNVIYGTSLIPKEKAYWNRDENGKLYAYMKSKEEIK